MMSVWAAEIPGSLSLQDEPIVLHINAKELTQRAGMAVKKLACRCCVRGEFVSVSLSRDKIYLKVSYVG